MHFGQTKCTRSDRRAFNLPIVAFTLSGDLLVLFSLQHLQEGHLLELLFVVEKRTILLLFPKQEATLQAYLASETDFVGTFATYGNSPARGLHP